MRKLTKRLLSIFVVFALVGVVYAEVNSVTPSTNDINRTNGWAYVDQLSMGVGETELKFVSTRDWFLSCFEYRTDGDTSQGTGTNYNTLVTDGLYPFFCVKGSTKTATIAANEYVEVRMVFGAEADERFDWTRFNVLPAPLVPDKITGGAESINVGGIYFSLAVNAIYTGKNGEDLKGKIQYSRDVLSFHADVECAMASSDGEIATVAGPIKKMQIGEMSEETNWAYVAIKEGGNGSGDSVRVRLLSETDAMEACMNPDAETSFPGIVEEGEFKIKLVK